MNVLWETMIVEMRAERTELDNYRHFTPEKSPIQLVRGQIAEWTDIPEPIDPQIATGKSATNMRLASEHDLFEVG